MSHQAKILADSVSPDGVPLTSFEITFPRIILAEFNTHRMFSRNSASSRAIPVEKMIERVLEDPYVPTSWGMNQKGMQAEVELSPEEAAIERLEWLADRDYAVVRTKARAERGVHKQTTNRLLEPFMWHTCIVTATEWDNFFHLRNNPQAHPEIQKIAAMMQELYDDKDVDEIGYGEWHMPLIGPEDYDAAFEQGLAQRAGDSKALLELLVKVSVARCARVSYLTHDGKRDLQADLDLHDRLLVSGHLSPFEHVARPACEDDIERMVCNPNVYEYARFGASQWWCGNFRGWIQCRKLIPNEADILAPERLEKLAAAPAVPDNESSGG